MKKNKIKLSVIKYNALKLRGNYQLPYLLVQCIYVLKDNDEVSYVRFLMNQCEHALRSKGYYKKYPQIEKQYNEELQKLLNDRTFSN